MKKKFLWIGAVVLAAALLIGGGVWYYFTHQTLHISLNGGAATVEYGTEYTDAGAKGTWGLGIFSFLEKQVDVTVEGAVDTGKPGTYELHYTARYANRTVTEVRTVTVVDTVAPTITLNGDTEILLDYGKTYEEQGCTAVDNCDGDLTEQVITQAAEDKIVYTVSDSSGNTATAERTLTYRDMSGPSITLKGKSYLILYVGDSYAEPGYTATDNHDTNVTVTVSGAVDTGNLGTYTLTYSAADKAGNKTTVTRTVKVTEPAETLNPIAPTGKTIYLTFDDGPSKNTAELLDVLKKYNAKATFFVVSSRGYADTIRRMDAEGHTVAVHCFTHDYSKIYKSTAAYWEDFTKAQTTIKNITGKTVTMFRFPGGSSNTVSKKYCRGVVSDIAEDAKQLGYTYYDWNVTSGDAGGTTSTDGVFKNVTNGIGKKNYAIVLQHDTQGFSVKAVERILIWGLNRGYTFAALEPTSPTAHHKIAN